jgi:cardiolipin-specific phospholipase
MDGSVDDSPVIAHSSRVDLAKPKHYLNTLSIKATSPSSSPPPPAVILHGYGAGLGFFFRNFPTLAKWAGRRGTDVYAVDWLGMGRSARVPFTVKAKREDIKGRVTEAESFFVDSLEEWREKMGLETMTLVGHSLGAYFSIAYALKYPTRVSKLVLLSPAGIPHDPNATSDPSRELTDTGDSTAQSGSSPDTAAQPATKIKVEEIKNEQGREQRQRSRSWRLIVYLWEEGWSPFQVVRSSLFLGPMIIGKVSLSLSFRSCSRRRIHFHRYLQYTARRFSGLTEEETRDMHDYIHNITIAKGSGEYCIC